MNVSVDWHELSMQLVVTLAHFLWQGAFVGVILAVALRVLSQKTPQVRYLFACSALATLSVCALLTFALVNRRSESILVANRQLDGAPLVEQSLVANQRGVNAIDSKRERGSDGSVSAQVISVQASSVNAVTIDGVTSSKHEQRAAREALISTASPYLAGIYVAGVLALLTRFSMSLWSGRRLRSIVTAIEDAELMSVMRQQASRLGLKRVPLVAMCERVSVPVVIGLIKPIILLPPALLCSLDYQHLAAILSHEMAHIRRYDLLVNLVQRIVESLLFFHPATWWISRRISAERELCCDDLAARGCGRLEYAGALLQMAEACARARGLKIATQLDALAADGADVTQLGYRIRRLLGEDSLPQLMMTRRSATALVVVMSLLGASALAYAQTFDTPEQRPSASENVANGDAHETPKYDTPSTGDAQPANDAPPADANAPAASASDDGIAKTNVVTFPHDRVIWWDAGDGLEAGFLLSSPDAPNLRIPYDSLARFKVLVRNKSNVEVRFLARLIPHEKADTPYLIPTDDITTSLDLDALPKHFRSEGGPSHTIEPAYIISLAPGESAVIRNQQAQEELSLYIGANVPDGVAAAQIKKIKPGMNWIVQPLQIHVPPPFGGTHLLLGMYMLTKISANGETRREPANRIVAMPGGKTLYPRIQLEVGTLNAAAARNAKDADWGVVDKGLQCGIRLLNHKPWYRTGDTIEAEVLWRNTSDAVITTPIPSQLDLYPIIRDSDNNEPMISFGARSNIYPISLPFHSGEVRSLGIVRIAMVADGAHPPKDNGEPGHITLQPGKYTLCASGGVSGRDTGNPRSAEVDFTVANTQHNAGKDASPDDVNTTSTNADAEVKVRYPYCLVELDGLAPRSLVDAIERFNEQSMESPIGRLQKPVTEQQALDAAVAFAKQPHVPESVRTILRQIVVTKQLPTTAYFRRFTRYNDGQQMKRVWWVRLVIDEGTGPVYSVPIRTKELFARSYTQMERQQIATGEMLIGRVSSYFETAPNSLLLREFNQEAKDRIIANTRAAIERNDDEAIERLFHWEAVSKATRQFATSELEQLRLSHIESIEVRPRNFHGNLIHWSAYQQYQPNLPIVGYLDVRYRAKDDEDAPLKTLAIEIGELDGAIRLVNYIKHGDAELPKKLPAGLSTSGRIEPLADGTFLTTTIITNPGSLLSGHIANEEVWKRDLKSP